MIKNTLRLPGDFLVDAITTMPKKNKKSKKTTKPKFVPGDMIGCPMYGYIWVGFIEKVHRDRVEANVFDGYIDTLKKSGIFKLEVVDVSYERGLIIVDGDNDFYDGLLMNKTIYVENNVKLKGTIALTPKEFADRFLSGEIDSLPFDLPGFD